MVNIVNYLKITTNYNIYFFVIFNKYYQFWVRKYLKLTFKSSYNFEWRKYIVFFEVVHLNPMRREPSIVPKLPGDLCALVRLLPLITNKYSWLITVLLTLYWQLANSMVIIGMSDLYFTYLVSVSRNPSFSFSFRPQVVVTGAFFFWVCNLMPFPVYFCLRVLFIFYSKNLWH